MNVYLMYNITYIGRNYCAGRNIVDARATHVPNHQLGHFGKQNDIPYYSYLDHIAGFLYCTGILQNITLTKLPFKKQDINKINNINNTALTLLTVLFYLILWQ
jgi:hypothetical protein